MNATTGTSNRSERSLLRDGRFGPLFFVQFWGALNDNLLKSALVLSVTFGGIGENARAAGSPEQLVALAGGVFILPFFVLSALAGEIADKFPKTRVVRLVKLGEIGIAGLAGTGFLLGSLEVLFGALFAMGVHSALFGPLKYAALPELVSRDELLSANALVELGTFLAILLGTVAAGLLLELGAYGRVAVALAMLTVALLGYARALRLPELSPAAPDLRISWNVSSSSCRVVRAALREPRVRHSVLGISWFWLLGSVVLSILPSVVKDVLGAGETMVTAFLAVLSLGIGAGSLLCNRLSARRLELGLVPLGSAGMSLFLLDAGFALRVPEPSTLRVGADLFLFALSAGLCVVPLYTLLQERTPAKERARVIAANNIVNAGFMVVGAGVLSALLGAGVSLAWVVVLAGATNLVVAAYIYRIAPEFLLRFFCACVSRVLYRVRLHGQQSIPESGPALLVSNHVSFVDWMVLAAATDRPIRFVMHHSFVRFPLKRLLKDAKIIPIAGARENPLLLERAFERIRTELSKGQVVCIFPEGRLTTDGQMQPFRRGIERILRETPVPVVPVHLSGLWRSVFSRYVGKRRGRGPRSRITIRIGHALSPEICTAERVEAEVARLATSAPEPSRGAAQLSSSNPSCAVTALGESG